MTRAEAEQLLLGALAVLAHTATHYPHALRLAKRLVDAAAVELLRERVKP